MSTDYKNLFTGDLKLKNNYYIVRHGQSEANVAGIVSSTYKVSISQHGLTQTGATQARGAASALRSHIVKATGTDDILLGDIIIYASDFARAYETGYFLRESLISQLKTSPANEFKTDDIKPPAVSLSPRLYTHPSLRERSFGDFEGQDHTSYEQVWSKDAIESSDSRHFNVESIASVVDRTSKLIAELEETWSNGGKHIALVSHGDICQIMLTASSLKDPREHRSIAHMQNCDVRPLVIGEDQ